MSDRDLWMGIRQALLMIIDVIERKHEHPVRTSLARKYYKSMLQSEQ